MQEKGKKSNLENNRELPLRSLFGRPELIKEYMEVTESPHTSSMGFLKLISEAQLLDKPLNQIFIEILKSGELTPSQLAASLDISEQRVKGYLDDLHMLGCITGIEEEGQYRYRVNEIWKVEKFPSGPIIPLIFQYNLLSDESRVKGFKDAIDLIVKDGDVAVDLGAGVGLLSHLTSKKAKTVYAVEIEPNVLRVGIEIANKNKFDNIEYVRGDARSVELPEKADVILCDLCDTALIAELQVPALNHAIGNYLKKEGKIIPYCARTTLQLIHTDFAFEGSLFRLMHYEAYGSRESESLSDERPYHEIYFNEMNAEFVDTEVVLTAISGGIVNGVKIKTYMKGAKELDYIHPSPWFNPPVVLPTEEDIKLKKADKIKVRIKYILGGGWLNLRYKIEKI
jgi:predicted RNA methylase